MTAKPTERTIHAKPPRSFQSRRKIWGRTPVSAHPPLRRKLLPALCSAFFLASIGGVSYPVRADGDLGEYQVKAGFLVNFARFVEWPPEVTKTPDSSLTFCIAGADPFHGELDRILQGKTIDGHPLGAMHLSRNENARACNILFISVAEKKGIPQILTELTTRPILTVGESDGFLQQGGMIGLLVEGGRVKFEVNLEAAAKAGLKISSRLLSLAKNIVGSPHK
jgi:hypothetical protein